MPYSIAQLNRMNQDAFIQAVGTIFEHTPTIAARTWLLRPFVDISDLHEKMVSVMQHLLREEQIALIQAHPDLGSRVKMADASVREQAGVGLDQLTPEEYQQFQQLNQAYKVKFGFPFIIAVKNHTKRSILDAFTHRLDRSYDLEFNQALTEITQIAKFRLVDLVSH